MLQSITRVGIVARPIQWRARLFREVALVSYLLEHSRSFQETFDLSLDGVVGPP